MGRKATVRTGMVAFRSHRTLKSEGGQLRLRTMTGVITATEGQWTARASSVAKRVWQLASQSPIIEADDDELVVRGILPAEDLDSGDENGWADGGEWRQDWTSGGATAGQYNQAYKIDSNGRAEEKVVGFYGVSSMSTTVDARQLRFGSGTSGVQGVLHDANIEPMANDEESRALLMNDVVYGPEQKGNVAVYLDAVNDGKRLALHGFVAEPEGRAFSRPAYPQFPGGGDA